MSKQESQRLLDLLKESFRNTLDYELGLLPGSRSQPGPLKMPALSYLPGHTSSLRSSHNDDGSSRPKGSIHATDQHLHDILTSPFFNPSQISSTSTGPATNPWDTHKVLFEKAVSRGLMTLDRAHGFLLVVRGAVKQSSFISLSEGLKTTGAGTLVLRWLRDSGQLRTLSFLQNRRFTVTLVQFLVAEGKDNVVLEWLRRSTEPSVAELQGFEASTGCHTSVLLNALVGSKFGQVELEGAYDVFLKAEDMLKHEGSWNKEVGGKAWITLAQETTMNSWKHSLPPVQLFEPFVAAGDELRPPTTLRAHIDLYHPTKPSSDLAMSLLSDEKNWIPRVKAPSSVDQFMRRIVWLGIDTVQHLMKVDRMGEATQLLTLLNKYYNWCANPHGQLAGA